MNKALLNSLCALVLVLVSTVSIGQAKTKAKTKAPEKKGDAVSVLKDVSKKYRGDKMVKIETDKKVTSELMGRTTSYKGTVYLSKGKFRWENQTPEESLLLFDGETIWNVQYPPKDLGGAVQVARAKLDKNTKSQILITTLIGKDPIDKNFAVLGEKTEGDVLSIELKSKADDLRVKQLTLEVSPKSKLITKISYKDDVENLTVIDLKNTEFQKENKSLFKYKAPKDAQVTNL